MLASLLTAALLAGVRVPASAQPPLQDQWAACADAAAVAEGEAGIPAGLLLAIGKVESGRVSPATGRVVPWPFALNVAGRGVYPWDAGAAMAEVRAAQAEGIRSIDVGCFQISLLHHPYAFASLSEAFDPARNAAYAARFLASLRAKLASWELAAGAYHSLTPAFGEPYAARVMATWTGAAGSAPTVSRGILPAPGNAMLMPVSFRMAVSRGVRVYAPGSGDAGAWSGSAYAGQARLPVVYSPTRR